MRGACAFCWVLACALLCACDGDDDDARDSGVQHTDAAAADAGSDAASNIAADAGTGWRCTESAAACTCTRVPIAGLHEGCVNAWLCCVSTTDACTCVHNLDCDAQAASMGGQVVPHCLPGTRPMMTCAGEGQNCTRAAIELQQLDGCCEGLVCKPYAGDPNVRLCVDGTPDERALATQCMAAASDPEGMRNMIALGSMLGSSDRQLPFDTVSDAVVKVGPGGCFSEVDVTLAQSNRKRCALTLHAGPTATAMGALVLAPGATLDMRDCDGWPVDARALYTTSTLAGTLVFAGLSCESGLSDEPWCEAGMLELHLTGTFPEAGGSDEDAGAGAGLSFDDAAVQLRGTLCGSMTAMSCPSSE